MAHELDCSKKLKHFSLVSVGVGYGFGVNAKVY